MISRAKIIVFFLSLSVFNAFGKGENNSDSKRFLLLDMRIIEKTENVKLEAGKVEKHSANPLFVEDNDWEMRFDNLYGNVIYDEKEEIYKCWYSPFITDSSALGMTLKERKRKYHAPGNRESSARLFSKLNSSAVRSSGVQPKAKLASCFLNADRTSFPAPSS